MVSFSQLPAKKGTKNGAAVMSLRPFLFHDGFSNWPKSNVLHLLTSVDLLMPYVCGVISGWLDI